MQMMPHSIRGRFSDFLHRQLSFPSNDTSKRRSSYYGCDDDNDGSNGSFINKYLRGKLNKNHPDILSGKTCYDLPVKKISKLSTKVIAAFTGPNGGLTEVNRNLKPFELADTDVDFIDEDYTASNDSLAQYDTTQYQINGNCNDDNSNHSNNNDRNDNYGNNNNGKDKLSKGHLNEVKYCKSSTLPLSEEIAGICSWDCPIDEAYGIATSLYESHPVTNEKAGEPIADAFGLCVRENSAILAIADGVNWGEKACLAARCAVHGCIDYLNKALYQSTCVENTMDIFVALLRSFNAAHNLILQENGMLTTLCAAVVCQLKNSDRFIVCTCNVGDSLAYVYSKESGVREITQGSHDIFSMRDMRDALGALGPVDGTNPELNNLTVAMTIVEAGDIVFLTSDGVSDNFDPVVGKFAMPRKEKPISGRAAQSDATSEARQCRLKRSNSNPDRESSHAPPRDSHLPIVTAQQRHDLTLLRMEDLLINGVNAGDGPCASAKELSSLMIEFSTKLTTAKRRILEDPDLYEDDDDGSFFGQHDQRQRRRKVGDRLAMVPGKLDHASIVSYKVAFYGDYKGKVFEDKSIKRDDREYNLKLKATLARFESQEDCSSVPESTL